jgi:ATP-dependent Clp protease ATP-binding subunit ClpA
MNNFLKAYKKDRIESLQLEEYIKNNLTLGYLLGFSVKFDKKEWTLTNGSKVFGLTILETNPNGDFYSYLKAGDSIIEVRDLKNNLSYLVNESGNLYNKEHETTINLTTDKISDYIDLEHHKLYIEFVRTKINGEKKEEKEDLRHWVELSVTTKYFCTDEKISLIIDRALIKNIPHEMNTKVYDQDHVINTVYPYIKLYKAQLTSKTSPIASFMLAGPTGTGKTEFAESLAKVLDMPILRLAMSDFQDEHSSSALTGAPPSYLGYNDKTRLEVFFDKNDKGVILLDEFDKATVKIQKLFLEVLDNGKATLMNGKVLDFSNTIIIMTSNAGVTCKKTIQLSNSNLVLPEITFNKQDLLKQLLPEFAGRVSGILEFKQLSLETIQKILDKFLREYNDTFLKDRNMSLELTEAARNKIIAMGFSPTYGARPLKNTFLSQVCLKIADIILFEEQQENRKIIVDYSDLLNFTVLENNIVKPVESMQQENTLVVNNSNVL